MTRVRRRTARVARLPELTLGILLVLASWVLLPIAPLSAQVSNRTLGVRWRKATPHLYFSARDVANRTVREKLQSGLPQTLITQIYAFEEGSKKPIAAYVRSCRIVFDLWEESYRLHIEESGTPRTFAVRSLEDVLSRCVVVRGSPVGRSRDFARARKRDVYFAVLVEFNPISDATVKRIRRWLAKPAGTATGNDAFFGSFVSLFVNNRIGSAERILRFRSQQVQVPP